MLHRVGHNWSDLAAAAAHTWNLLKIDLKCSHHIHIKELTMWGDGYVNFLDLDNNFPMYMYIKSSCCIL